MENFFDRLSKGAAQAVSRRDALKDIGRALLGTVVGTLGLSKAASAAAFLPRCTVCDTVNLDTNQLTSGCADPNAAAKLCKQAYLNKHHTLLDAHLDELAFLRVGQQEALKTFGGGLPQRSVLSTPYEYRPPSHTTGTIYLVNEEPSGTVAYAIVTENGVPQYGLYVDANDTIVTVPAIPGIPKGVQGLSSSSSKLPESARLGTASFLSSLPPAIIKRPQTGVSCPNVCSLLFCNADLGVFCGKLGVSVCGAFGPSPNIVPCAIGLGLICLYTLVAPGSCNQLCNNVCECGWVFKCNGQCCEVGTWCCPDNTCHFLGECCNNALVTCGATCCAPGQCCNGACCPPGNICSGGRCIPCQIGTSACGGRCCCTPQQTCCTDGTTCSCHDQTPCTCCGGSGHGLLCCSNDDLECCNGPVTVNCCNRGRCDQSTGNCI